MPLGTNSFECGSVLRLLAPSNLASGCEAVFAGPPTAAGCRAWRNRPVGGPRCSGKRQQHSNAGKPLRSAGHFFVRPATPVICAVRAWEAAGKGPLPPFSRQGLWAVGAFLPCTHKPTHSLHTPLRPSRPVTCAFLGMCVPQNNSS